jgi:hypothetical protein
MRQLSDGERELWNEMQRDGAPYWRTLSSKVSTRGARPIHCDVCDNGITSGQRYTTVTGLEDGKFVMIRHHVVCPERSTGGEDVR